jgi:hypothetical protein
LFHLVDVFLVLACVSITIVSSVPVEVSLFTIVPKSTELAVNHVPVEKLNDQLAEITDPVKKSNCEYKSSVKLEES